MKLNMKNKIYGSRGGILIIVGIIVVAIVVAIIVMSLIGGGSGPGPSGPTPTMSPLPIYELTLGNTKFKLETARNKGNTLNGLESNYPEWKPDLTTTEKFVEVTITAENTGKENISEGSWDIKEIFDSEGRKFEESYDARDWVSTEIRCGALLKPAFAPTSCTRIYEVAAISIGLKIKVYSNVENQEKEGFIDLGL